MSKKEAYRFRYPIKDIIQVANEKYPIDLKKISNIITRVQEQYPLVDKTSVVFIIKEFIQEIRDRLIRGEILSLSGYFVETKMHFFRSLRKKEQATNAARDYVKIMKIKIRTPGSIK